jgi:hypothetical protein
MADAPIKSRGNDMKKHSLEIYEIARTAWIKAKGNKKRAAKIAEKKIQEQYGSIAGLLGMLALFLQVCLLLFDLWEALHTVVPPITPDTGALRALVKLDDDVE